ncbi:MAG: restriction endonuclease subunit S [Syntrophomonadaceae bacterium]|jgi:restriction endonuclease S subunit
MKGIKYRSPEEMKDSGIDWIGLIPDEWKLTKIKYNTYVKGRIGWQGLRAEEFTDDGPFLVTGTDFINGKVLWSNCYHISNKRYKEAPEIHLMNNDLLITKDGSIGKLAIVKDCPDKAILNSGIFVTRCTNEQYLTKYMFYILSSIIFKVYIDLSSNGSTIQHLYQATFINFCFALPELREQQKITNFLDIKTAQFDSIISKKELLIKKLEEAKKSLISEVVTGKVKIVDGQMVKRQPEEMKDSGVEWLGMIPKDWVVKRIRHVADVVDPQPDHRAPKLAEHDGYPYVGIRDINEDGTINYDTCRKVELKAVVKQERAFRLESTDIVFCRVATLGYPRFIVKNQRIALSATLSIIKPKDTLRLFGTQGSDNKYYPFHNYSMRQAIEEGFILDVLKNYMTYKMFYNLNKKIEEDPAFDKSKATKSIARYVSLHPHNISQKTEIMVEHFRNFTMKKIGGTAKAMLVTSSRLHAVRYKLAFDEYIRLKGYYDLKTLVAFSGTVKEDVEEFRESKMNDGISEAQLPAEFDKDESRILIVANKYQTGFDQPRLHTMYVDKKLSGVKAVQTLSRLNRICPGKEDTFILDFVNDPEEIRQSFLPFYRVTFLDNDIEPNEIYTLERTIYDQQVINKDDVKTFTDIFYKDQHSKTDISIMNNCVDNSVNRMSDFSREETIEFKNLIQKFMNLYTLIIQVASFVDTDLHRLNIYLRFLVKKIEIESTGGVNITDKVLLQYYRLEKKTEGSIYLDDEGNIGVDIKVTGGGQVAEAETDLLSNIIAKLNEKYGTNFSESERLAVEQISFNLKANKDLELKAKVNSYDVFKLAFEPQFLEGVI